MNVKRSFFRIIEILIFLVIFSATGLLNGAGRWVRQAPRIIPASGNKVFKANTGTKIVKHVGTRSASIFHIEIARLGDHYSGMKNYHIFTWKFNFNYDLPPAEIIEGKTYPLLVRGSGSGVIKITRDQAWRKWQQSVKEPDGRLTLKGNNIRVKADRITISGQKYPIYILNKNSGSASRTFYLTIPSGSSFRKKVTLRIGVANCYVEWDYLYLDGGSTPDQPRDEQNLPGNCGKGALLTRFIGNLRNHNSNLNIFEKQIDSYLNSNRGDPGKIVQLGNNLLAEGNKYLNTLIAFSRSETRKGLFEELDLMINSTLSLNRSIKKYQKLRKIPVVQLNQPDANRMNESLGTKLYLLAAKRFASRFESEGLSDILSSSSFKEAVDKASYHSRRKVHEFLTRETQKMLGLGFYDLASAKRALRLKMRRELYRQAAKLFVKITSNEIVIELIAGPLIRWIGRDLIPRLREALRQKGNQEQRVAISVKTMYEGRRMLFSLPCNANLKLVSRTIGKARGIIHSARFIEKDLKNSRNYQGLEKLSKAKGRLSQAIHITTSRFLLDKADYFEDMDLQIQLLRQMLQILKNSIPRNSALQNPNNLFRQFSQRVENDPMKKLHSRFAGIRFFESGIDAVSPDKRVYGNVFSTASSRYIYWELKLEHFNQAGKIFFTINEVWKKSNGTIFYNNKRKFYIPATDKSTYYCSGFGSNRFSNWTPGSYRLELFIEGKKVASGNFTVR